MLYELLILLTGSAIGYKAHDLWLSDIYYWISYFCLPLVNAGIRLEQHLVNYLDTHYANQMVPAYEIRSCRKYYKGHLQSFIPRPDDDMGEYTVLYVTYNETNQPYEIIINTYEQYDYIMNKKISIKEPIYRWLRRNKPSSLNLVKDHRQIIGVIIHNSAEDRHIDCEPIHLLAGPAGDFFADIPGNRDDRMEGICRYMEGYTGSSVDQIECILATGDILTI